MADQSPLVARSFRLHVDEVIAGTDATDVDVVTGQGNGDCGFGFEVGKQYFIDTYHRGGTDPLYVGICSQSRPIEEASALLPELRAIRDHQPISSLFGYVQRYEHDLRSQYPELGNLTGRVPGATVRLQSNERTYEAHTDEQGRYSFRNLPQGTYSMEVNGFPNWAVGNYVGDDKPAPAVEVPDGACEEQWIDIYPTGSISGVVADAAGKPIKDVMFHLLPPDYTPKRGNSGAWDFSDDQGRFKFSHVGEGDYILAANISGVIDAYAPYPPTYFPGVTDRSKARVIHLSAGEKFLASIKLPQPLRTREFEVRINWPDGRPAKDAYPHLAEASGEDDKRADIKDAEEGVYRVKLFRGVEYQLKATMVCQGYGTNWGGPIAEFESNPIQINDSFDLQTITLVLNGEKCPPENVGGEYPPAVRPH